MSNQLSIYWEQIILQRNTIEQLTEERDQAWAELSTLRQTAEAEKAVLVSERDEARGENAMLLAEQDANALIMEQAAARIRLLEDVADAAALYLQEMANTKTTRGLTYTRGGEALYKALAALDEAKENAK